MSMFLVCVGVHFGPKNSWNSCFFVLFCEPKGFCHTFAPPSQAVSMGGGVRLIKKGANMTCAFLFTKFGKVENHKKRGPTSRFYSKKGEKAESSRKQKAKQKTKPLRVDFQNHL
jgi:hypothetical protein